MRLKRSTIALLVLAPAMVLARHRSDEEWTDGVMTYYTSNEGGPEGAGGKRLKAFKSVAVPASEFDDKEGKKVKIEGYGTFRVDDACAGDGCRDFDVFVGDDEENAHDLDNWELGRIPIRYKWT